MDDLIDLADWMNATGHPCPHELGIYEAKALGIIRRKRAPIL